MIVSSGFKQVTKHLFFLVTDNWDVPLNPWVNQRRSRR